jgi:hypothetical protein
MLIIALLHNEIWNKSILDWIMYLVNMNRPYETKKLCQLCVHLRRNHETEYLVGASYNSIRWEGYKNIFYFGF